MADLTDLEITRLCAQAMAVTFDRHYNPLLDDAQVMALVKHMDMPTIRYTNQWIVSGWYSAPKTGMALQAEATHDTDLNRAICLCVARMEQEKERD